MHITGKRFQVGALVCALLASFSDWPQAQAQTGLPMATKDRVQLPGWWPTKGAPARDEFLGPAACAGCHSAEAAVQSTTSMAKAGGRALDSKILAAHPQLTFHQGPYTYDLARADSTTTFTASDGTASISAALDWAFGEGEVGETYIFQRQGAYYEARLSYFPVLQALDITPGQPHTTPASLEKAMGRAMDAIETRLCFGCHTTASSAGGQFHPEHLIPSVTCEACHGPGSKHVAAMKAGHVAEGRRLMLNPARLDPVSSVDFCGACHRAWADVMESGMEGIATVRFQPYRLEMSRCWGKGDARLACLTCHDPHMPLVSDLSSYDGRCLACHRTAQGSQSAAGHPGAACPRATKDCATCHMPKYEVPGTHTQFTDHWIRMVKPGQAYPD